AKVLDRERGPRLWDAWTTIVKKRLHATERLTSHDHVAHAQRAALDQQRRYRPATLVHLRLDHGARGRTVGIRLRLHFGLSHQQNRLEQRVEPSLSAGGDRNRLDVSAVFGDHHAQVGQLLLDPIGVRGRKVYLVDG